MMTKKCITFLAMGAMHTVNQYYLYYINNNRLDVLFELIQESIIITQCLLQLHGYNAIILSINSSEKLLLLLSCSHT